jgi:hypothetical protein
MKLEGLIRFSGDSEVRFKRKEKILEKQQAARTKTVEFKFLVLPDDFFIFTPKQTPLKTIFHSKTNKIRFNSTQTLTSTVPYS